MDALLSFYGKILKGLSGLLSIVLLIIGFVAGGKIFGYYHFNFGMAFLGMFAAFVANIFIFGLIGMICDVNTRIDELATNTDGEPAEKPSKASEKKDDVEPTYESKVTYVPEETEGWKCSCGAENPPTASLCWKCGSHK